MNKIEKFYPVLELCKSDIKELELFTDRETEIDALTDEEMENIASNMADVYMEDYSSMYKRLLAEATDEVLAERTK